MSNRKITYTHNPDLPIIKANWRGNKMIGDQFAYEPLVLPKPFSDILKWQFTRNPQRQEKKNEGFKLKTINNPTLFNTKEDGIVWMGHSSFFIRLNGVNILTDPVYHKIPFVPHLATPPCKTDEVRHLDYILLSHDHRDHFDEKTLTIILKNNPQAQVLMPLRMANLLQTVNNTAKYQEAGWYQSYNLPHKDLQISYLPAKHWCRRGLTDVNKILWGSFMLTTPQICIYFAGDTGYDHHFKEIATLFPTIDVAFMPIGAYKPPFIMQEVHVNPYEAVQGFNELQARHFIPMHYGTFDLSDEPVGEPIKIVQKLYEQKTLQGTLHAPAIGEVLPLGNFFRK